MNRKHPTGHNVSVRSSSGLSTPRGYSGDLLQMWPPPSAYPHRYPLENFEAGHAAVASVRQGGSLLSCGLQHLHAETLLCASRSPAAVPGAQALRFSNSAGMNRKNAESFVALGAHCGVLRSLCNGQVSTLTLRLGTEWGLEHDLTSIHGAFLGIGVAQDVALASGGTCRRGLPNLCKAFLAGIVLQVARVAARNRATKPHNVPQLLST